MVLVKAIFITILSKEMNICWNYGGIPLLLYSKNKYGNLQAAI